MLFVFAQKFEKVLVNKFTWSSTYQTMSFFSIVEPSHPGNYAQLNCSNLPSANKDTLSLREVGWKIEERNVGERQTDIADRDRYAARKRGGWGRISMMHRSYCFISEPLTLRGEGAVRLPLLSRTRRP